jgi:hypothetical protein
MKLPLMVMPPVNLAQAADPVITADEPGLEIVHDWSVGKNPVPLTLTLIPGLGLPTMVEVRVILGPVVTLKIA